MAHNKFRARCKTCGGTPKMVKGVLKLTKRKNLKEKHESLLRLEYKAYREDCERQGNAMYDTLMIWWPNKRTKKPGFYLACDCGNRVTTKKKKSWARDHWNRDNGGWKNAAQWALVDKLQDPDYKSDELIRVVHELKD